VQCTGGLQFRGKARLGCTGTHGWTSLYPAFAASCNAYFGQLGIWVGQESMAKWAGRFGLGKPTGIDLPGEHDGNVDGPRTQEAIYRRFGKEYTGWYHGDSANMAIGQGGMLVTPLQLAVAAAAVANGGTVVAPTVVRSIDHPGTAESRGTIRPRERHSLGLGTGQMNVLREAMGGVVYAANGTSRAAQLPGIDVRGKSGSAESRGKGSPTHAWFVCYAAKRGQEPALAVAVWVDAGGKHLHGGSHAAPIARKVIARYFGIVDKGALIAAAVRD
ncbi:MAG: penicillin-binding transpeptidase domain-containing protein, partial [Armatimonadota bacterium]